MGWWGTVLGGAFGYMLGGPLGALLGAALGRNFDRGLGLAGSGTQGRARGAWAGVDPVLHRERAQAAFFTASFAVMGHVAKADGRVSPEEIRLASAVMDELGLDPAQRRTARTLFREGKADGFPLDDVLAQLRSECGRSLNVLRAFLEIQLHAAYADGSVHPLEREVLERICERLGIPSAEIEALEALVRAHHRARSERRGAMAALPLEEAWRILGLPPGTPDAEVKKAYRRLMNRHHPDKLVSQGLPDEMIKAATERTQDIKRAYDRVKEARGQ